MSFPKINSYMFPIVISAHSAEDAIKVKAALEKLYWDHGIQPGTTGMTAIEFKNLQPLKDDT